MSHARVVIAFLVSSTLVAASAFARNPPQKTGKTPSWDRREWRPVVDIAPAVFDGPPVVSDPTPFTSGTKLPVAMLQGRTVLALPGGESTSKKGLKATPLSVPSSTSILYTANANGGFSGPDVEPANVAIDKNGATYDVLAFSHWTGTNYQVQASAAASATSSAASFTAQTLYLPTGYNESGDPMVAMNPYTDGARPGAVYASAFVGYRAPGGSIGNPMQIRLWGSNDGGVTWDSGQAATGTTSTSNYTLDKPVMDVSWYPTYRGYIYVAWVEDPIGDGGYHRRIVYRRNWGGLWQRCRPATGGCDTAWDAPITMDNGAAAAGAGVPQVVVNHDNGHVYVFWVDSYGRILMRRSTDGGVTFFPDPLTNQAPIVVVTGINLVYGNNGFLPNGLRANVVPTIKYNTATHQVVAVWHARTQAEPTNETALYYAGFDASTITGPLAWWQVTMINDAPGTQMQPAIDNDNAGNMLVTYFSTENYGSSYQPFALCLGSSGQPIPGCGPAPLQPNTAWGNTFIGDYHENFFWSHLDALGARWTTSWTNAAIDPQLTGVQ